MKSFNIKILLLAINLICLLAFPGYQLKSINPIITDHNSVAEFENIPDSIITLAIPIKLMFQHASVGTTVNDGLNCVQGTRTNPKECDEFPDYKYDRRNWEFQPRGNSGWYGKIKDFVNGVETQIDKFDIFSFKYCYLDGLDEPQEPCGSPFNNAKTEQAWNALKDSMESLEARYPNKKFVWWTIPLTQVGMFCTDTLNTMIRNYVIENGKILFDIADIEAYDTLNNHILNNQGWEKAFKPYCGEPNPEASSCHPSWLGKLRIAKAYWWMMTKIASAGITDVKEKNLFSDNEIFTVYIQDNLLTINLKIRNNDRVFITIHDLIGRKIFTGSENGIFNDKIDINISNNNPGFYFITVSNGKKFEIEKIIINN